LLESRSVTPNMALSISSSAANLPPPPRRARVRRNTVHAYSELLAHQQKLVHDRLESFTLIARPAAAASSVNTIDIQLPMSHRVRAHSVMLSPRLLQQARLDADQQTSIKEEPVAAVAPISASPVSRAANRSPRRLTFSLRRRSQPAELEQSYPPYVRSPPIQLQLDARTTRYPSTAYSLDDTQIQSDVSTDVSFTDRKPLGYSRFKNYLKPKGLIWSQSPAATAAAALAALERAAEPVPRLRRRSVGASNPADDVLIVLPPNPIMFAPIATRRRAHSTSPERGRARNGSISNNEAYLHSPVEQSVSPRHTWHERSESEGDEHELAAALMQHEEKQQYKQYNGQSSLALSGMRTGRRSVSIADANSDSSRMFSPPVSSISPKNAAGRIPTAAEAAPMKSPRSEHRARMGDTLLSPRNKTTTNGIAGAGRRGNAHTISVATAEIDISSVHSSSHIGRIQSDMGGPDAVFVEEDTVASSSTDTSTTINGHMHSSGIDPTSEESISHSGTVSMTSLSPESIPRTSVSPLRAAARDISGSVAMNSLDVGDSDQSHLSIPPPSQHSAFTISPSQSRPAPGSPQKRAPAVVRGLSSPRHSPVTAAVDAPLESQPGILHSQFPLTQIDNTESEPFSTVAASADADASVRGHKAPTDASSETFPVDQNVSASLSSPARRPTAPSSIRSADSGNALVSPRRPSFSVRNMHHPTSPRSDTRSPRDIGTSPQKSRRASMFGSGHRDSAAVAAAATMGVNHGINQGGDVSASSSILQSSFASLNTHTFFTPGLSDEFLSKHDATYNALLQLPPSLQRQAQVAARRHELEQKQRADMQRMLDEQKEKEEIAERERVAAMSSTAERSRARRRNRSSTTALEDDSVGGTFLTETRPEPDEPMPSNKRSSGGSNNAPVQLFPFELRPLHANLPYHLQGDAKWYRENALARRLKLSRSPTVKAKLQEFWLIFERTTPPSKRAPPNTPASITTSKMEKVDESKEEKTATITPRSMRTSASNGVIVSNHTNNPVGQTRSMVRSNSTANNNAADVSVNVPSSFALTRIQYLTLHMSMTKALHEVWTGRSALTLAEVEWRKDILTDNPALAAEAAMTAAAAKKAARAAAEIAGEEWEKDKILSPYKQALATLESAISAADEREAKKLKRRKAVYMAAAASASANAAAIAGNTDASFKPSIGKSRLKPPPVENYASFSMSKSSFHRALFEVADLWTEGTEEEEYAAFLSLLLARLTKPNPLYIDDSGTNGKHGIHHRRKKKKLSGDVNPLLCESPLIWRELSEVARYRRPIILPPGGVYKVLFIQRWWRRWCPIRRNCMATRIQRWWRKWQPFKREKQSKLDRAAIRIQRFMRRRWARKRLLSRPPDSIQALKQRLAAAAAACAEAEQSNSSDSERGGDGDESIAAAAAAAEAEAIENDKLTLNQLRAKLLHEQRVDDQTRDLMLLLWASRRVQRFWRQLAAKKHRNAAFELKLAKRRAAIVAGHATSEARKQAQRLNRASSGNLALLALLEEADVDTEPSEEDMAAAQAKAAHDLQLLEQARLQEQMEEAKRQSDSTLSPILIPQLHFPMDSTDTPPATAGGIVPLDSPTLLSFKALLPTHGTRHLYLSFPIFLSRSTIDDMRQFISRRKRMYPLTPITAPIACARFIHGCIHAVHVKHKRMHKEISAKIFHLRRVLHKLEREQGSAGLAKLMQEFVTEQGSSVSKQGTNNTTVGPTAAIDTSDGSSVQSISSVCAELAELESRPLYSDKSFEKNVFAQLMMQYPACTPTFMEWFMRAYPFPLGEGNSILQGTQKSPSASNSSDATGPSSGSSSKLKRMTTSGGSDLNVEDMFQIDVESRRSRQYRHASSARTKNDPHKKKIKNKLGTTSDSQQSENETTMTASERNRSIEEEGEQSSESADESINEIGQTSHGKKKTKKKSRTKGATIKIPGESSTNTTANIENETDAMTVLKERRKHRKQKNQAKELKRTERKIRRKKKRMAAAAAIASASTDAEKAAALAAASALVISSSSSSSSDESAKPIVDGNWGVSDSTDSDLDRLLDAAEKAEAEADELARATHNDHRSIGAIDSAWEEREVPAGTLGAVQGALGKFFLRRPVNIDIEESLHASENNQSEPARIRRARRASAEAGSDSLHPSISSDVSKAEVAAYIAALRAKVQLQHQLDSNAVNTSALPLRLHDDQQTIVGIDGGMPQIHSNVSVTPDAPIAEKDAKIASALHASLSLPDAPSLTEEVLIRLLETDVDQWTGDGGLNGGLNAEALSLFRMSDLTDKLLRNQDAGNINIKEVVEAEAAIRRVRTLMQQRQEERLVELAHPGSMLRTTGTIGGKLSDGSTITHRASSVTHSTGASDSVSKDGSVHRKSLFRAGLLGDLLLSKTDRDYIAAATAHTNDQQSEYAGDDAHTRQTHSNRINSKGGNSDAPRAHASASEPEEDPSVSLHKHTSFPSRAPSKRVGVHSTLPDQEFVRAGITLPIQSSSNSLVQAVLNSNIHGGSERVTPRIPGSHDTSIRRHRMNVKQSDLRGTNDVSSMEVPHRTSSIGLTSSNSVPSISSRSVDSSISTQRMWRPSGQSQSLHAKIEYIPDGSYTDRILHRGEDATVRAAMRRQRQLERQAGAADRRAERERRLVDPTAEMKASMHRTYRKAFDSSSGRRMAVAHQPRYELINGPQSSHEYHSGSVSDASPSRSVVHTRSNSMHAINANGLQQQEIVRRRNSVLSDSDADMSELERSMGQVITSRRASIEGNSVAVMKAIAASTVSGESMPTIMAPNHSLPFEKFLPRRLASDGASLSDSESNSSRRIPSLMVHGAGGISPSASQQNLRGNGLVAATSFAPAIGLDGSSSLIVRAVRVGASASQRSFEQTNSTPLVVTSPSKPNWPLPTHAFMQTRKYGTTPSRRDHEPTILLQSPSAPKLNTDDADSSLPPIEFPSPSKFIPSAPIRSSSLSTFERVQLMRAQKQAELSDLTSLRIRKEQQDAERRAERARRSDGLRNGFSLNSLMVSGLAHRSVPPIGMSNAVMTRDASGRLVPLDSLDTRLQPGSQSARTLADSMMMHSRSEVQLPRLASSITHRTSHRTGNHNHLKFNGSMASGSDSETEHIRSPFYTDGNGMNDDRKSIGMRQPRSWHRSDASLAIHNSVSLPSLHVPPLSLSIRVGMDRMHPNTDSTNSVRQPTSFTHRFHRRRNPVGYLSHRPFDRIRWEASARTFQQPAIMKSDLFHMS
jgi:hypothetical protein